MARIFVSEDKQSMVMLLKGNAETLNNGSPMAPISRDTHTAISARLPPRRPSAANTAKVCIVNSTVAGMLIHEHTAISAAISAM